MGECQEPAHLCETLALLLRRGENHNVGRQLLAIISEKNITDDHISPGNGLDSLVPDDLSR